MVNVVLSANRTSAVNKSDISQLKPLNQCIPPIQEGGSRFDSRWFYTSRGSLHQSVIYPCCILSYESEPCVVLGSLHRLIRASTTWSRTVLRWAAGQHRAINPLRNYWEMPPQKMLKWSEPSLLVIISFSWLLCTGYNTQRKRCVTVSRRLSGINHQLRGDNVLIDQPEEKINNRWLISS